MSPRRCAQRRKLDARDGEAVEEVVAEAARLDLLVEIAPRRGHDAHIDVDPLVAADAAELRALDRAQELRLERDVEIADLVDEQRAAVGLLEEPLFGGDRAGERAALVPEERRFEQVRRDRGAIEDDEGTAGARAPLVQRLGEQLLAGAGLAFDDERARRRPQSFSQSG